MVDENLVTLNQVIHEDLVYILSNESVDINGVLHKAIRDDKIIVQKNNIKQIPIYQIDYSNPELVVVTSVTSSTLLQK